MEITTLTREPPSILGKTRTRQHVIADLGVNYLERHVLLSGFTALRVQSDYGYDLIMSTYNEHGEIEPGAVYFQVKATDHLPLLESGATISWPVSRRDLKLWLEEAYPVVLVLYDGRRNRAYWLHLQAYFLRRPPAELFWAGESINVHVSVRDYLSQRSVRRLARLKRDVHQQLRRKEQPDV
jgi:hypothetical protein